MNRILRRTKRKLNRVLSKEVQIVLSIVILIALVSLVIALTSNHVKTPIQRDAKYELTKDDIFSLDGFHAKDISVMGIKVGDRTSQVLEILGTPDKTSDYTNTITNFEYSNEIGLDSTGLIISLDNGIVTSITVREPFNEFLQGETTTDYTKEEIYNMYGIPDKTTFAPLELGSFLIIRIITYQERGIEFIIRKNDVIGFSLILVDPLEKTPNTHVTEVIPSTPHFNT